MSNYRDWVGEDTPPKKKLPALDVGPFHGVLPFEGARNPLTRSNTAKRISAAIATPRTGGVRQVYHFDGEAEFYVAVEALLSEPRRVCRRLQLLSKVEHHEQDNEQVFSGSA
jgi:hypothetical protein